MGTKQTDARTAIIALMRDDRERTFNDILTRVRGDSIRLQWEITQMIREGIIDREVARFGGEKINIYRMAQVEAAE